MCMKLACESGKCCRSSGSPWIKHKSRRFLTKSIQKSETFLSNETLFTHLQLKSTRAVFPLRDVRLLTFPLMFVFLLFWPWNHFRRLLQTNGDNSEKLRRVLCYIPSVILQHGDVSRQSDAWEGFYYRSSKHKTQPLPLASLMLPLMTSAERLELCGSFPFKPEQISSSTRRCARMWLEYVSYWHHFQPRWMFLVHL